MIWMAGLSARARIAPGSKPSAARLRYCPTTTADMPAATTSTTTALRRTSRHACRTKAASNPDTGRAPASLMRCWS